MNSTKHVKSSILVAALLAIVGCDQLSMQPDLVDLNVVIDQFIQTVEEESANSTDASTQGNPGAETGDSLATDAASSTPSVPHETQTLTVTNAIHRADATLEGQAPLPKIVAQSADNEDPEALKRFLTRFAAKLNDSKMISKPIGVELSERGSIIGFADLDKDMVFGEKEAQLFSLQIDSDNNRIIAIDTEGHRRPYTYRGHTFFMYRTMYGRQSTFYTGRRAFMKPNFGTQVMSPPDYFKSAVKNARFRTGGSTMPRKVSGSRSGGGIRGRAGSGGFSFGK